MQWERVRQVGFGDSSSCPGKRWGHTCNAIKGGRFLYVFGGWGSDGCLTNQVHVFDVEKQIWTHPVINGVPPCPRDSHSCTTVKDNLFVFGGSDGKNHLNDLHILDTSSHTWMCPDILWPGPRAREGHSAALVDKRLFIFGGCGKSPDSDDEVFYNDLYLLDTETYVWRLALTLGKAPCARDNHTCSTWKNKIIVVGGQDLDERYLSDVHILDTDKLVWSELKASGQILTPRAGHVTVAFEKNLFVFGGTTDPQNLYGDLHVLDLEWNVWSKIVAMEERPSARFSSAAVCLDPYKAGSFFLFGGCNQNLEPLDDIYYLHTGVLFDQDAVERLSPSPGKQMNLKCQDQNIGLIDQGKMMFEAKVTEIMPLGYSIETIIDGKVLRGVLLSNIHSSNVQMAGPSFTSRKRPATSEGDCDRRAKIPRILSKDSPSTSQQADPIEPFKVADSNAMDTHTIDTIDANTHMAVQEEAETVKDQLNKEIVYTEQLPVIHDLTNVEPLRHEISTDAAKSDHRAKKPRILSKDSAGTGQQADPIAPSDGAKKKVADFSNAMDTHMIGTIDVEEEAETVKDQLDKEIVNTEPLPVIHDLTNVEPLRHEISTADPVREEGTSYEEDEQPQGPQQQ